MFKCRFFERSNEGIKEGKRWGLVNRFPESAVEFKKKVCIYACR